jgi:hypothetical protein
MAGSLGSFRSALLWAMLRNASVRFAQQIKSQEPLFLGDKPIGSRKENRAEKNTEAHKKQSNRPQHETIALWRGKRWAKNGQSSKEAE